MWKRLSFYTRVSKLHHANVPLTLTKFHANCYNECSNKTNSLHDVKVEAVAYQALEACVQICVPLPAV